MHIVVAHSGEAGSQKANLINTVNLAQGFAQLGHAVTFVCTRRVLIQPTDGELKQVYGLTESMQWIQFLWPSIRGFRPGKHWCFARLVQRVIRKLNPDFVFARNYIVPVLTSRMNVPTALETHAYVGVTTPPFMHALKGTQHPQFRLLVTISSVLADYYQSLGVPGDKVAVLPTGVRIERFKRPLHLPPSPYTKHRPVVAYVGNLYENTGIETVIDAAMHRPSVSFHLVGGRPSDVMQWQGRVQQHGANNVSFHGMKPQSEVPSFLWYADILLLPYSAHHPAAQWMSPVKLGEYLASGTPVIATAIPALRNLLTGDEALFIQPDSPEALVVGIDYILNNSEASREQALRGYEKAKSFSCEERALTILRRSGLISEQKSSSPTKSN